MDGGWIYILATSQNYRRFKIGRTIGNPLNRFKTLRTGDPFLDFFSAYFIPAALGKLSAIENEIHRQFEGERIFFHDDTLSEWFAGEPKYVCQLLEALFEDWSGKPIANSIQMQIPGRICRAYEEDLISYYGPVAPLNKIDGLPNW